MRYISYVISLGIGLFVGAALMFFISAPRSPSTILVNIYNESGGPVFDVTVSGQESSVTLNTIAAGSAKVVPLLMLGEGTYEITATLSNGTVLSGDGGYVESGYKVKDVIKPDGIEHEHLSFY